MPRVDLSVLASQLVCLLDVANAGHEAIDSRERIRNAFSGLCGVVGGGVAIVADLSIGSVAEPGRFFEFAECGGWTAAQRQLYLNYLSGQHHDDPFLAEVCRRMAAQPPSEAIAFRRQDVIADAEWYGCAHYAKIRAPIGLDACVYAFMPARGSSHRVWAAGIHRHTGSPAFALDELELIRLFFAGSLRLFEALHHDPEGASLILARLSPRQRDIAMHLAGGESAKQIAARLSLSVHSVRTYTKRLFREFGVSERSEFQARCNELGVLPPADHPKARESLT